MLNSSRLLELARRWKRMAILGKKRISWNRSRSSFTETERCNTSIADKGHFFVYASEGQRFMVPLELLKSSVFVELLSTSEEEFGLRGDGPITLPYDAAFIELVLSKLRKGVPKNIQNELLMSIGSRHSSLSSFQEIRHCPQLAVY